MAAEGWFFGPGASGERSEREWRVVGAGREGKAHAWSTTQRGWLCLRSAVNALGKSSYT